MADPGALANQHLRIAGPLGEGGMGEVYRASLDGRPVAVKFLKASFAGREAARQRFVLSASVLTRLSHPAVIGVHQVVEDRGRLGLVMDLVIGPSLDTVIHEENRAWNAAEVRRVMAPVLEGMAHVHAEGVIHRDLKPSNILLSQFPPSMWPGNPVIIDFDLVKAPEGADLVQERTGARMGTYAYMAPEQYRGDQELDARADVFSLGMILWHLLAGRLPITNLDEGSVDIEALYDGRLAIPRLTAVAEDVPPRLADAVARALSLDPTRRPANARELLAAIGWSGWTVPPLEPNAIAPRLPAPVVSTMPPAPIPPAPPPTPRLAPAPVIGGVNVPLVLLVGVLALFLLLFLTLAE